MKINATTLASLAILARKLRWQFEKMIILQAGATRAQDLREPPFGSQIITVNDT
jgi:hypothetical protein